MSFSTGNLGQNPVYTSTLDRHGQTSAETYIMVSKIQFSKSFTSSEKKKIFSTSHTVMILSIIHIHCAATAVKHHTSR